MLSSCSFIYPLGSYSQHEADRLVGLVAHGTCTLNDGGVSRAASLSYGSDVCVFVLFCFCLFVCFCPQALCYTTFIHSFVFTGPHYPFFHSFVLTGPHCPFIYSFLLIGRPHYPFIHSFLHTRPHYPFFDLLEF